MISASVTDTVSLVRSYADERSQRYFTTDEIRDHVIEEWRSTVWPRIVTRGDTWYATTATTGVTSSVAAVGVPSDMARAKRLILVWGTNDREMVLPLAERERHLLSAATWSQYGPKRYVLSGATCTILPTPTQTVAAQWVYLPTPSTTTITGPEGTKRAVALAAAIVLRDIQDEPTTGLERRYEMAMKDVERQAGEHYNDDYPVVVDTLPEYSDADSYEGEYRLPRA